MRFLRKLLVSLWVFLFLFCLFGGKGNFAFSQEGKDISFLIIDKTKTPWGHKFFKTFSQLWKSPGGIEGYSIVIEEKKPSFRQSWIYVSVGDNIYFQVVYVTLLKPTTSEYDMQKYAVAASRKVLRYLLSDFMKLKAENEVF